jgi:molybdopterin-dependent oxidoreductase alpha subunit
MSKVVLAAEAAAVAAGRPSVLDHAFIAEHCDGFDAYIAAVEATSWDEIISQSGLTREAIERAAEVYMQAERVICTWAMGITQHLHSVATIREISNFMFLRGNVGKPGAGLCPVRGHSNVQGDRTVGINEKPPAAFLDALEKEFGFAVPRANGHNVIAAIGAMLDGSAQAFIGLGGNFARATPDSALVEQALRKLKLTVHVATKPNHSHLMPGDVSFILPCLGRTEIDLNSAGNSQLVSVEDSMSMVHGSAGINRPASPHLLSEVAIVAGMAASAVGSDVINWAALADDYDLIRNHIEKTIPGFEDFNTRLRKPRGFHLRNTAAHREWVTPTGKACFSDIALPAETVNQAAHKRFDHFALQTFRSHDQYNTTVYGLDDRYRGVYGERQVIFMHPEDVKALSAAAGERVDVVCEYNDGVARVASDFRLVPYDIPRGSIAGYYPELNVLVPIGSAGEESDTPTSKSVMVSVRRREAA